MMASHLQNWPFTDGLTQLKCSVPMREEFKVVFHLQHRSWLLSQSYFCPITMLLIFSRLKLEERRKTLVKKLEETTKLTTYLHLQLKRWVWIVFTVCTLLVLKDHYLIFNIAVLFQMRFCEQFYILSRKNVLCSCYRMFGFLLLLSGLPHVSIASPAHSYSLI